MNKKKIVYRMCTVTRERLPKRELIRIVRTPDNKVVIDESGKLNGRGAYLKLDEIVIDKAKKSKILNKHLEIEVPNTIYDELEVINRKRGDIYDEC